MSSNGDQLPNQSQEVKSPPVERSEAYDFESTKAGKGAVTSQYYRTFNIPERFNNPDQAALLINNPGNPVFSCPTEVEFTNPTTENEDEDWFEGYSAKKQNPMYMTSAMNYGSHRPTVHTMPTSFHAKCQKFTEHLGKCGMYRNQSLNTAMDKSIV